MITNHNACLHVSIVEDTNPTLTDKWLSPEEVQEQEAACNKLIEQQHSLRQDNTSCKYWPETNTRNKQIQSFLSYS